jgi:hypothetical protein
MSSDKGDRAGEVAKAGEVTRDRRSCAIIGAAMEVHRLEYERLILTAKRYSSTDDAA